MTQVSMIHLGRPAGSTPTFILEVLGMKMTSRGHRQLAIIAELPAIWVYGATISGGYGYVSSPRHDLGSSRESSIASTTFLPACALSYPARGAATTRRAI